MRSFNVKLIPIVVLAVLAGRYSYFYLFAFVFNRWWYPSWAPKDLSVVSFITLAACSLFCLMVTGILPALYERVRRLKVSDSISYAIWGLSLLALIGATQLSQNL